MKKLSIFSLLLTPIVAMFILLLPLTAQASIASSNAVNDACSGVQQIDSTQSCSSGSSSISSIISSVVNILSIVLGAIAIIMIIVSGSN